MSTEAEFYAWAVPSLRLKGLPDHTWVTDFDSRKNVYKNIADVIAAKRWFWYCWGDFHPRCRPKGALGQSNGNLGLAQCLVLPNAISRTDVRAQGTIFRYGIDGVCHQLANQILYATGRWNSAPLTVKNARGYQFSIFRYGTYGRPEAEEQFLQKIGTCGGRRVQADETMTKLPDEFETHAREVLGKSNPKLLSDLLALRRSALRIPVGARPTAESLNAQNQQLFDEAAKLLGPTIFRTIFGFSPAKKIDLVDPALMKTDEPRITGSFKRKSAKPVTTRVLAAALAENHQLSKKQGLEMLEDLIGMVTKHLKKGERVKIAGLGILQVRKRAARMGRNPATGEAIKIKASKKVAFRAAKDLKEAI